MITIEIKEHFTNTTIFKHSCINNTFKKTIEKAVELNVSLSDACLENVNLEFANLKNANLQGAVLFNVNLKNAKLKNAKINNAFFDKINCEETNFKNAILEDSNIKNCNFTNAILENTNVSHCKFSNCILINADFRNADLFKIDFNQTNFKDALMPIFHSHDYYIKNDKIKIGSSKYSIAEWEEYFVKNSSVSLKHKKAVFLACKAYIECLNS
jgi:hypothetical protein